MAHAMFGSEVSKHTMVNMPVNMPSVADVVLQDGDASPAENMRTFALCTRHSRIIAMQSRMLVDSEAVVAIESKRIALSYQNNN